MKEADKNLKRVFKWFTIAEYEKEQEYLREEHKNGWKFVSVTYPGNYTFERCTPEDVVYQLDYNQDREKEMSEYTRMFEDCGWEYICDFVGYSYFRKPVSQMQGEEEIFSDDSSKVDMIQRVFLGRMLPLLVIFFLIICPQLINCFRGSSSEGELLAVFYIVLFLVYLVIFIRFGFMFWKLRKKWR